jgi:hypothetical protein
MTSRIVFEDAVLRIAHWRCLQISHLVGTLGPPQVAVVGQQYRLLARGRALGIAGVVIVHRTSQVADAATRQASTEMMKSLTGTLKRVAIVVEAAGVFTSMLSSILRMMNVAMKDPVLYMYTRQDQALRELAPILAEIERAPIALDELTQVITSLRPQGPHLSASAP